jgi:hypothetical protein
VKPLMIITPPFSLTNLRVAERAFGAEFHGIEQHLVTAREADIRADAQSKADKEAWATESANALVAGKSAPTKSHETAANSAFLAEAAKALVAGLESKLQAASLALEKAQHKTQVAHTAWLQELRTSCEVEYQALQSSFVKAAKVLAARARALRADRVLHSLSASAVIYGGRNLLVDVNRPAASDKEFSTLVQEWSDVIRLDAGATD